MPRACALLLVLLVPAAAAPQAIARPALEQVPVKLTLDRAIWQQPAGSEVKLQVGLRNAFDQPAAARADLRVVLRSPALEAPITVTIPAGQSTAQAVFAAPRAGTGGRIDVVADGLQPASCVLLVRDAVPTAGAEQPTPPPPPPPPPPPVVAKKEAPKPHGGLADLQAGSPDGALGVHGHGAGEGGGGAVPGLGEIGAQPRVTPRIFVNPEQVSPDAGGQWSAVLKVAVLDEGGRLVAAGQAFPVQLTAQVGRLSTDVVTFKAGEFLSPAVALTSGRDGVDHVVAVTPLGTSAPAEVAYQPATPARLRVDAPERVSNDGGGAQVQVAVLLVSAGGVATTADRDVPVSLRTSLGQLAQTSLLIPRGAFGTATTLGSTRDGRAVVSADAPGLAPAQAAVRFSFPLLLAVLAGAGGVTGQLLLRARGSSKRAALWRSAVTGLVVGLLFYGVASFHAFKEGVQIPLPVEVSRIATGNELGAFLLGCLGGLVGKGLWKLPASGKKDQPSTPAPDGGAG